MNKTNLLTKLLLLCLCVVGSVNAWATDTVLFSTDFSNASWSEITSICNSTNASDETYNGITFHSYNSTAKPFAVDKSKGTMTWCNNNMSNKFYIAIPVTGVNGSLTITVANSSSNTRFNYVLKKETSISGSPGSGTSTTSAAPSTVTISNLDGTNYVVYLGRQGSSLTTVTSITITTPAPSGDAIILDKTLGTANGSGTIAANATSFTPTAPTYAGHTVDGYYATYSDGAYSNYIANAAGELQPDVTVSETAWTNGSKQWVKGGAATFYTKWKVNAPTVSCEDNTVTITIPTGSTVYYTTDGETEPTSSSNLYSAPFAIAATTTVKAIAIQDYCTNSSVTTQECAYSAPKTATTTTISGTLNGDIKNGKNAGTLTAAVTYGDPATEILEPTIVWSSTDESVATVDAGVVTLVGEGSTTIKARYEGDATYEASEDTYDLVVIDSRKAITLSFSSDAVDYYHYDGETFVAPTLSAIDEDENPVDIAELAIVYSVDRKSTQYTKFSTINASTGELTFNESVVGIDVVTASFEGDGNYLPASSVSYQINKLPLVRQVKFTNTFDAFIDEGENTVTAYYVNGQATPTVNLETIRVATGHTASVSGSALTVTETETSNVKTYTIVTTAVTPFEGSGKQTFDGTETYVASGYGWDADKKWKFSKTDNDWTREAPGKSRLYFFVGAASSASLSFATTTRAVTIKVNGVSAETDVSSITLNADQPNMIEIQSNQTNGDGGFKDITLTDPKKSVKIASSGWTSLASAYALDFSTAEEQESVALKAYAISSISKTSVTLTPHDAAPAEEGMILKGKAGSTYYIPITTSVEGFDNELDAAVEATTVAANSVYAVSEGKLKLFTGTTVPAGKAYLQASKVDPEARGLSLNFDEDGETTGIAEINSKKGLLDGDFYDLSGRKVAQPTKGLYIMNGRKVIVK